MIWCQWKVTVKGDSIRENFYLVQNYYLNTLPKMSNSYHKILPDTSAALKGGGNLR